MPNELHAAASNAMNGYKLVTATLAGKTKEQISELINARHTENKLTVFECAALYGSLNALALLLQTGMADLNYADSTYNLFDLAANNPDKQVLQFVASSKHNFYLQFNDETSEIDTAALLGNIDAVLSLLKKDPALFERKNRHSQTFSYWARLTKQTELIKALIKLYPEKPQDENFEYMARYYAETKKDPEQALSYALSIRHQSSSIYRLLGFCTYQLAERDFDRKNYYAAATNYLQAIEYLQKISLNDLVVSDPITIAEAHNQLGNIHSHYKDLVRAKKQYEQALERLNAVKEQVITSALEDLSPQSRSQHLQRTYYSLLIYSINLANTIYALNDLAAANIAYKEANTLLHKAIVGGFLSPSETWELSTTIQEQLNKCAQNFEDFRASLLKRPTYTSFFHRPEYTASNLKLGIKASLEEDVFGRKKIEERVKMFQQKTIAYGFNCVNVDADGNCFFHALAEQLKIHNVIGWKNLNHEGLRLAVIKHIRAHLDNYIGFMDNNNAEEYFEKMGKVKTWVDNLCISAFSQLLKMNFAIVRSNDDQAPPTIYVHPNAQGTIYLGWIVDLHYVSLVRDPTLQATKSLDELIQETVPHEHIEEPGCTATQIEIELTERGLAQMNISVKP